MTTASFSIVTGEKSQYVGTHARMLVEGWGELTGSPLLSCILTVKQETRVPLESEMKQEVLEMREDSASVKSSSRRVRKKKSEGNVIVLLD